MKNEIREKMKQGMSIENICDLYGVSFKELLKVFSNDFNTQNHRSSKFSTGHSYIQSRHKRFVIIKNNKHYGTYKTLDDAIKVRDGLVENDWCKERLDGICEDVNVKRCRK